MNEIYASKNNVLNIGFMGEDNRTRVHFPIADLKAEFPGCSFVLLIKRAGDNGVYVVEPVIIGDEALWTVEDGFLANKGEGEAVLICSTGTVTAKRKAWKTWTDYSLSGGVTPPADFGTWVTELLQAGADVQAAVDAFNEITAEATEGEQTSAYIDRTGDHPVLKITIRSGGDVQSVNGKTGVVSLNASDVHALPDSTSIPVVDNALSGTSENTIQNKVVKAALDQKANSTTVSQLSETIVGLGSKISEDEKALYSLKNEKTYTASISGFVGFPFHVLAGQKYRFENASQGGVVGDVYSYTGTFSGSTRHLVLSGNNVAPGEYVEATAGYNDENFAVFFSTSGMTIHVVATEAYLNTLDQRVGENSQDISRLTLEKADTGITTLTRTDYTITDGRINSGTGAVVDGSYFKHVEIDVENFDRISFVTAPQGVGTSYGCAFYDSNGTYISGVGFGTSEIDTKVFVDVPQGAKKWKYGFYKTWWNDSKYTTFTFYDSDQTIYGIQNQIDELTGKNVGVVCFGDSLTQGNQDGTGDTYPKYLATLLGESVYNAGVGGENSLQIASRQGGIHLMAKPFTIPADTTPVAVELACLEHDYIDPFYVISQANGGINPVEIGGVTGTLTFTGNWSTQTYTYTFTRSTAGDEVAITRPTPIKTATSQMRERVQIFWVGTNDSPYTLQTVQEKIVPRIDAMIAWTKAKSYLVIGLTAKVRFADLVDCNTYMQRHFGTRFIDISRYILQYGLQDESITPTAQDNTDIANGEIPTSLRTDTVHLNRYGYDIVANQVYKRGQLLGYWE